eukprot:m.60981 g.60981  ORF g.60981 m.60981 type:complete len:736 (-) comp11844_c0_seq1:98-2305(-)
MSAVVRQRGGVGGKRDKRQSSNAPEANKTAALVQRQERWKDAPKTTEKPTTAAAVGAYVVLVVASVVANVGSWDGEFVFDDMRAVETNPILSAREPYSALLTHDFWGTPMSSPRSHKSFRPVTSLTFKFQFEDPPNAVYFHLGNMALHCVATVLLFTKLRQLTDSFAESYKASLLSAFLFAVHPIHTEAVCNVVGRADVLAGVFFLGAWCAYPSWARGNHLPYKIWALRMLAFAILSTLATFSKELGITIVGVAFAEDSLVQLQKTSWKQFWRVIENKAFVSTLLSCAATGALLLALRLNIMEGQRPIFNKEEVPAAFEESFLTRLLTMNYYVVLNVVLLFFPVRLCHDYSHNAIAMVESLADPRLFAIGALYATVIVSIALLFWKLQKIRSNQLILAGIATAVISFLPASNLLFPVGFVLAERVLYLPSIGICLIASGILLRFGAKAERALVVLIVLLAIKSVTRSFEWHDNYSIHKAGFKTMPHNVKIATNWALLQYQRSKFDGLSQREQDDLVNAAESTYKYALQFPTDDAAVDYNYGTMLLELGREKDAVQRLEAGLKKADVTKTPAKILSSLGGMYFAKQQYEQAKEYFVQALQIDSLFFQATNGLGVIAAVQHQYADAVTWFTKALEQNPRYAEGYFNRGTAQYHLQNHKQAISDLRTALYYAPRHTNAATQLQVNIFVTALFTECVHLHRYLPAASSKTTTAIGTTIPIERERKQRNQKCTRTVSRIL